MTTNAHIVGWGKYLPEKVMTNSDIAKILDISDDWIKSRTGISERRLASSSETTTSMAVASAQLALDRAGIAASAVDLIIVASGSQEYRFPSTACLVQDALGASHAGAYDLSAACSGFIYALTMAAATIQSGLTRIVLVIGSESISRFLNERDTAIYPLFGDGAGALVLQTDKRSGGVLATVLGSDGSGGEYLTLPNGVCKNHELQHGPDNLWNCCPYIQMDGSKIYRSAIQMIGRVTQQVCDKVGLEPNQIDLFIPHQANIRIIESAFKHINISKQKVFTNLGKYGNTGAASVPIALCEAIEEGRLQSKDKLVLVGFGGGLAWGATLIEWGILVPDSPGQQPYYRVDQGYRVIVNS